MESEKLINDSIGLKTLQINISKLTSAYDFIKEKLKHFDKQLNKRIFSISIEINKHIEKLFQEIEILNNLLKNDLENMKCEIQIEKSKFDKSLEEVGVFLKTFNSNKIDIENELKKLKDYQKIIESIPDSLNKSLHSLKFIPSDLKCTIGNVANVLPIDKFVFNFSVNYKPITKPLCTITDCMFNQHLLLLERSCNYFHIINRKTLNYEHKVTVNDNKLNEVSIKSLCAISHRSQIALIDNKSSCAYLLNKNYELIKQVNFSNNKKRRFEAIEFNIENKCIYILDIGQNLMYMFDDQLNLVNEFEIKLPYRKTYSFMFKIYCNKIYINDILNKCYHVFDKNMKYLKTFGNIDKTGFDYSNMILCDTKNFSNYLLISDLCDKSIKIFDSVNYELIKTIALTSLPTINDAIIIDNTIHFITDDEIQVYDII